MATMTDPIPSAGETTIIGLPAITVPVTSTGDRPLTKEDLDTIMRLDDGTALLISTRGAVSGSRYLRHRRGQSERHIREQAACKQPRAEER